MHPQKEFLVFFLSFFFGVLIFFILFSFEVIWLPMNLILFSWFCRFGHFVLSRKNLSSICRRQKITQFYSEIIFIRFNTKITRFCCNISFHLYKKKSRVPACYGYRMGSTSKQSLSIDRLKNRYAVLEFHLNSVPLNQHKLIHIHTSYMLRSIPITFSFWFVILLLFCCDVKRCNRVLVSPALLLLLLLF